MLIYLLRLLTNPTHVLLMIHKKYGDFIHTRFFNKTLVFVSNADYFQEIFSLEGRGSVNRDSLYQAKLTMFGNGLFNSKGDVWANQRKLMHPVFSKNVIGVWQDIILEEANIVATRIEGLSHQEVNFSREIKAAVQKILIRLMFNSASSEKPDELLMRCVDVILEGLFPHFVTATLGKGRLKHLFFIRNRRMNKAVNYFKAYVEAEIQRKRGETEKLGLLAMMMDSLDKDGNGMTDQLLNDETVTLFLAGQDTTVNTLIWFFYLLGKNPDQQRRVIDEIKRLSELTLTLENIGQFKYTHAALYEAMRLYPQAIALSRDAVLPITFGEKELSTGTTLIMNIVETHRSPVYWEKPDQFYPEHFLTKQDRHKFAFIPFGAGMHSCIGRHLAEYEMMLIIITFLSRISVKTNLDVKPALSITLKPERDVILSATKINS